MIQIVKCEVQSSLCIARCFKIQCIRRRSKEKSSDSSCSIESCRQTPAYAIMQLCIRACKILQIDDGLMTVWHVCSHLLSYALHPPCHWNHECCCTNRVFFTWWHVKSFGRCQLDSVDCHAWAMDKKIFRILLFFAENIVNMHRQSDVLC